MTNEMFLKVKAMKFLKCSDVICVTGGSLAVRVAVWISVQIATFPENVRTLRNFLR